MDIKQLRDKRRRNHLPQGVVAAAMNRTKSWLCNVEHGRIAVDSDVRARISQAIDRLRNLRAMNEKSWDFSDLRLSDPKNRQHLRK